MDFDRLNHSISVARKMVEIGSSYNLNELELQELFLLGFNHDIGYEYSLNGENHNQIGGNILKNSDIGISIRACCCSDRSMGTTIIVSFFRLRHGQVESMTIFH